MAVRSAKRVAAASNTCHRVTGESYVENGRGWRLVTAGAGPASAVRYTTGADVDSRINRPRVQAVVSHAPRPLEDHGPRPARRFHRGRAARVAVALPPESGDRYARRRGSGQHQRHVGEWEKGATVTARGRRRDSNRPRHFFDQTRGRAITAGVW